VRAWEDDMGGGVSESVDKGGFEVSADLSDYIL